MDRHGEASPSERLILNPTADLLVDVLREVDPAAFDRYGQLFADPLSPRVTANGLSVPIVRVAWNRIDDFFEQIFTRGNERFFLGRLPRCRRIWNERFRRLAGRIECRRQTIELSSAHYEQCGAVAMGIVLVHEMIHLALFADRLSFGHTPEFKRRSRALGLPGIYHELPLPNRMVRAKRYVYGCPCGARVESRVKFRQPRACGRCCRRFARGRFDPRFVLTLCEDHHPTDP